MINDMWDAYQNIKDHNQKKIIKHWLCQGVNYFS